jgi:exopolyphosphatase/guanosine-5'-triphosphate,3'-diphosphate pyrophosphatase
VTSTLVADAAESAGSATKQRLAAIDVGSNSVRLLVAEYDPAAGLSIIDELKDQPRLAQGLARRRRLQAPAAQRALETLARMRDVCQRRGVTRIAAVATAAVREARNGEDFVKQVRAELGIPLRIISPEQEARLSWRSVVHHFDLAEGRTVVADIGGGSLELIGAVRGLVDITRSLPLGAVRLTEKFGGETAGVPALDELRALAQRRMRKALPAREWRKSRVIGSGGTFTTLARMALARRGDPIPDSVHATVVTTAEVEHLLEWLAHKTPAQRRAVAGLSPERSDIIVAGVAVVAELLDLLDARELAVSSFGLREGLLLEMAGAKPERRRDPLRLVREFMERCQTDRRHVEHVRWLSLRLLDQLGDALGCDEDDRAILEAAALLHDVGQLVSYKRHHRHSYDLIMHAERLPFSPRERRLVALVSRYHRKSGPKKSHEAFASLPPAERKLVQRVSALLRVADGLDRGHQAVVEDARCTLTSERLLLEVSPRFSGADVALEVWGAQKKSDVLADRLGVPVEIRAAVAP